MDCFDLNAYKESLSYHSLVSIIMSIVSSDSFRRVEHRSAHSVANSWGPQLAHPSKLNDKIEIKIVATSSTGETENATIVRNVVHTFADAYSVSLGKFGISNLASKKIKVKVSGSIGTRTIKGKFEIKPTTQCYQCDSQKWGDIFATPDRSIFLVNLRTEFPPGLIIPIIRDD
jgi:hypothetical protein